MKCSKAVLSFLLIFTFNTLFAQQCLPDGVVFETQTAIDNFFVDNPGCTEIIGSVEITGAGITNLNGLSGLQRVEGHLWIKETSLATLAGLESLEFVGSSDLFISGPNIITTITGISLDVDANPNLESLAALDNLLTIDGEVKVTNNTTLTTGLNHANSIGTKVTGNDIETVGLSYDHSSVLISNNPSLTSFNCLTNITTLQGDVVIRNNASLVDVDFSQLMNGRTIDISENTLLEFVDFSQFANQITDDLLEKILIENNPNLTEFNMNALVATGEIKIKNTALETIVFNNLMNILNVTDQIGGIFDGTIIIQDNPNLNAIAFNQPIQFAGGFNNEDPDFVITNNPNLEFCASTGVCNYLETTDAVVTFENNATGCSTENEVSLVCDSNPKIFTTVFFDLNEDGVRTMDEPYLNGFDMTLNPFGLQLISSESTEGEIIVPPGAYTLIFADQNATSWNLTTPSELTTNVNFGEIVMLEFGVYPTESITNIKTITIAESSVRCNQDVVFDIVVENLGTTIVEGVLWIEKGENLDGQVFIDPPDIIEAPSYYGWSFSDLHPRSTLKKQVSFFVLGPPDITIGDSISIFTEVDFMDVNSNSNVPNNYEAVIACAYDPNDKQVSPIYFENYNLIDEELIYTIRFQNVGNAEAIEVSIEDEISLDLDMNTFRVITSSHQDVLTTFIQDHDVEFLFSNINLPDSTSNFEESNGYITYAISANEGIAENTIIQNTANIFFDNNPAIVTNTTENIMLSTFDVDEDGFSFWEDCDPNDSNVFPGAPEIADNDIDEDCDGVDLITNSLSNLVVNTVQIFPNPTTGQFEIVFAKPIDGHLKLKNTNGKVIAEYQLSQSNLLDLKRFACGVYIVEIHTDHEILTNRVVKID